MLTENIKQAVALLQDENLVWSSDMQDIKTDLANLLLASAAYGDIMQALADNLAKKICYEEQPIAVTYDLDLEKR